MGEAGTGSQVGGAPESEVGSEVGEAPESERSASRRAESSLFLSLPVQCGLGRGGHTQQLLRGDSLLSAQARSPHCQGLNLGF